MYRDYYKRRKRGPKYNKIIVVLVILLNVIYTGAALWIFKEIGAEPTTLTVSWFAFTTGELMALALIRIKDKQKKEDSGHEY